MEAQNHRNCRHIPEISHSKIHGHCSHHPHLKSSLLMRKLIRFLFFLHMMKYTWGFPMGFWVGWDDSSILLLMFSHGKLLMVDAFDTHPRLRTGILRESAFLRFTGTRIRMRKKWTVKPWDGLILWSIHSLRSSYVYSTKRNNRNVMHYFWVYCD